MNCSNCRKDSIPLRRAWLAGRHETYRCPNCGAPLRFTWSRPALSLPLRAATPCLSAWSVILGFRYGSWLVFVAVFAAALAIGALAMSWFGRFEPDAPPSLLRR